MKLGKFSLTKGVFLVAVSFLCANLFAQSTNRQVGTQFTVTADPLVQRPHTPSCVVQLFNNFQFALFSETNQTFSFTPPANCAGPYDKVVLDVDFSENAGIQFDRTASIYLGNTNIYFGTTPEPLQNATNTWHIERDLTDYSALLADPQQGTMVLQNCTGQDCGSAFSFLNGVFTVNAKIEFFPAPGHSPAPRTADVVLPMTQSNGGSGLNLPIFLTLPPNSVSNTFNLPTNIEEAYLDVVSQSQQADEQWYACFPNDLSAINDFFGCGNTDFRETDVAIDGVPAGFAPVSPWVFTGFLPDQWTPIPGAQTLNFVPYRVNLTPFAGVLSNGQPHTITLSVFDQNFFFAESASLLLFLDHGASQVTGEVTQNTLSAASPVVTENVQIASTATGTIGVAQNRNFTIAGFVNTSHGKVSTSVSQQQNFSSNEAINFDITNFNFLDQNTSLQNNLNTLTKVSSDDEELVTSESFSFPINVDVAFPAGTFGFTAATTQNFHSSKLVLRNGNIEDFSSATNTVTASDVAPNSSSQHFTAVDKTGPAYDCEIATQNNVLTSVSKGCKH